MDAHIFASCQRDAFLDESHMQAQGPYARAPSLKSSMEVWVSGN